MSFAQRAKNFIGWESTRDSSKVGSLLNNKTIKKTVVTLGTMRAGKTTHLAGLGATAQYKSSDSAKTEAPFRFLPQEGTTNLLEDIAELRSGHFPEATKPVTDKSEQAKPAYIFEWEEPTFFGSRFNSIKRAEMPVIDYAGEQLVKLMAKVRAARTFEQASAIQGDTDQLTVTINQCSALLIIINAERAEGLPCFKPDPQLPGMSKHPDVNCQRMILPILEYKNTFRQYSPPLERIAIVITACDILWPHAKTIQSFTGRTFDPVPANGNVEVSNASLDAFMKGFFPGTHSLICSLQVPIQYFPSYFELEGADRNDIQYWDVEKKEPKIKRGNIFDSPDWEHNINRPKYTEYWFNREIEWLKEFATRV
jgi:hypothetical protein